MSSNWGRRKGKLFNKLWTLSYTTSLLRQRGRLLTSFFYTWDLLSAFFYTWAFSFYTAFFYIWAFTSHLTFFFIWASTRLLPLLLPSWDRRAGDLDNNAPFILLVSQCTWTSYPVSAISHFWHYEPSASNVGESIHLLKLRHLILRFFYLAFGAS